jgi:hypothetical protein
MTLSQAQSRWINTYYGEKDAWGSFFTESYDNGYLILGKHGSNAVHFNWLIKTDINGAIIWEKTFGNELSYLTPLHISVNELGDIFICGSERISDDYSNPVIVKLDSCGGKQWCKIFHTPGIWDYAFHTLALNDQGCIVLIISVDDPLINRLCLVRFDVDGNLSWKEYYNSQDTSIWAPFGQSLIQTQDSGFLITGKCYYEDPDEPNLFLLKPYYIKTDKDGNFEWETVVHKDIGSELKGSAWSTSIDPSGSYYYSSIAQIYPEYNTPSLLKMDLDGNVIDIYDIVVGYNNGGLGYATFINDTVLAASIGWGNTEDDHKGYAVLLDTLGNILDTTFLVQDIYTKYMDTAYDEKLIYMYNTYQNGQFDVHLRKLNYNLEDDTLYSFPFQYDTLCPYPIASDTISLDDCDLIVGVEEEEENGRMGEEEEVFYLYPNPASQQINCRLSVVGCRLSMFIYDMFGRRIEEIVVPDGQQETTIDVSTYSQGIYIAVLMSQEGIIGRRKFVVRR